MTKHDEPPVHLTTYFEGTEEGSRQLDHLGGWPALLVLVAMVGVITALVLWLA